MKAIVMSRQIVELLTKQQQLSIDRFGNHSTVEPMHTCLCEQLTILRRRSGRVEQWAKCLMLAFGGALRNVSDVNQLANNLDIYNLKWYPISWIDIQRELFEMQIHNRFDDWKRWSKISRCILICAISYKLSIQQILSSVDKRLMEMK